MTKHFSTPEFSDRSLELRYENDVVCIYGTAEGLALLMKLCNQLIENPSMGHVHLEHYSVLTDRSEKGAIAIFDRER